MYKVEKRLLNHTHIRFPLVARNTFDDKQVRQGKLRELSKVITTGNEEPANRWNQNENKIVLLNSLKTKQLDVRNLLMLLVFGRVAAIPKLKMFLISKKQELLGLVFSLLLTNHIVQTDERKIFPEVKKDEQGWEIRFSVKVSRNKTHLTSTMTLKYTRPTDTGLYTCAGAFAEREKRNRFFFHHQRLKTKQRHSTSSIKGINSHYAEINNESKCLTPRHWRKESLKI
ncbi:hypothetical protein DAPPUDRAFT_110044 [Daphnia pulex]|uniref:Uncharacterized protein n=1 Tax=Daphnia pulex TaxID=6669 RepID=E9H507_DAPPU|nr:hypothetical protein DAPPUDRAFT_110044 [Daphnia pulex]|eukprot:EFX73243.1 hypothetical protein DAPPUDRAFT_110044 [Daphnia pulex]